MPTATRRRQPANNPGDFKAAATQAAIDFIRAYLECSDEMQAAIHDMMEILEDVEATQEEKSMALRTVEAILFPSHHNGSLGIALTDAEELGSQCGEAKHDLERMDEEEATFANRLRAFMEEKGINQNDLAQATGVGQPAISNMLTRHCRPQRRTVEKIASYFKIEPSELWPGVDVSHEA
jgi:antitoxin component HigA of HigAB toxin-antitoxin module